MSLRCRPRGAAAETLELQPLIAETLANNRELRAAESRIAAAGFRITQAVSRENKPQSVATGETGLGIADKAANLERCKSSYHQLPESDG